ncbi:melatonin receptor type 1B-B-like [Amphiura filiformis]|uniref:melatonin receptor type 1B-B-like n=1 Tax=Amphiura filiformis TaxID=82378 RepID=UPI003B21A183
MNEGYFIITIFVTIVGIIGNSLVICALLVHKRLRVLSNLFIANLALADLFVAGIIHPFTALGIIRPEYFYNGVEHEPTVLCEILASLCVISCCSSLFSITAVAINRYVYICHRQYYPKIFTRRTVFLVLIGIWVLSTLVDLPNFIGFGRHVFHVRTATCFFDTVNSGYGIYFIVSSIVIPVFITSICYTRIVILVLQNKRRLQNRIASEISVVVVSTSSIKPADVKLIRTVAIIGTMGLILYTPFSFTLLFDDGKITGKIWMFSTGLMHSYSCINWCIYALTNHMFRTAYVYIFKKYIFCPFFKDIKDINVANSSVA